jgi:hypothetical protein
LALWPQGHTVPAGFRLHLAGFPTDFLVVGSHVCCGFVFLRRGFKHAQSSARADRIVEYRAVLNQ